MESTRNRLSRNIFRIRSTERSRFLRQCVVTALAAVLVSALPCGAVGAEPVAPGGDHIPTSGPVNYTATRTNTSVIVAVDAGALVVEDGIFKITDGGDAVLAGTELSFRVDDFVFPVTAEITDHTATLTPRLGLEHAVYQPVALPFEDQATWRSEYEREQAAWSRLGSTILMGSSIGSIVGGVGGATIGCILGGIAGATIASATIIGLFGAFLPAAFIGCLGGILALAPLGAVAGQIFVTGPIAVLAAIQYFTTINAPFPQK